MAVTPDDIAVELGRTTPVSPALEQWQSWIDRAYRLIREQATRVKVDYDSLDPETVDDVVVLAVAKRVLVPADGADSYSKQVNVDDGGVNTTRSWRSGKIDVLIFDDWWRRLGLSTGTTVRSVRLSAYPEQPAPTVLPTP